MPIPLLLCVEFLFTNRSLHQSFNLRLQEILDVLRDLKNVNNLDQNYVHLLELSCVENSLKLVREELNP
jgi:hypothetical protein